ncbi:MAG: dimethylsulfoxide reductase subunit B [Bacteroidales bacterium]|nr:dimethylsulfoxide reductase subunit B [Bacteroidales bacterium]MCF8387651.1 dimethylsulfoxide reductase subunit B [Bacteroidales bacterium]MCF8399659.1 dimethylsulfoxide reductase subunit B [Bacteroidales bacterium]
MKQYAFYFDSNACSGCKACEMACRDKHDLPEDLRWRRVYEIAGGQWSQDNKLSIPELVAYNISLSCNHCEDPACVHACPTSAMQKREDGIVFIDPEKCMGCKYCSWACPYDAPQYDKRTGLMTKCDFCMDYIDQGKEPSCVAACPMRVLDFGELHAMKKRYPDKHVYPLPTEQLTKPAFCISQHAHLKGKENMEFSILNKEEVS